MTGCGIDATNGSVGSIDDLLFDEETWAIRWLVVSTGVFFAGRRVLLAPSAVLSVDAVDRALGVDITRQQVKESPEIDFDAPVSRRHESSLYSHYGWHPYWAPPAHLGASGIAPVIPPQPVRSEEAARSPEARVEDDPHLRSTNEVTGYYVHATDGDIGHVEDIVVDTEAWVIRYVAVDTVNWAPGKKVLIAPTAVTEVIWSTQIVNVDLTREQIQAAPEYLPGQSIDRSYEERYHDHYGYPYYWR